MASWLKIARTEPTMGSLLSRPSTMMLFERARWPPNDRPEVAEAPCCGVRSVVTPGVMTEKLMKLRPLMGRLSICCLPHHRRDRRVRGVDHRRAARPTVISSLARPRAGVKSIVDGLAEAQHHASRFCGAKPGELRP